MEFALPFVFLLLSALGFIEVALSRNWNLAYFRSGFSIFRKCRQITSAPLTVIDAGQLESLVADTCGKLQFSKAGNELYLFREEYSRFLASGYTGIGWYSPVMHGNLVIGPERNQIEVIGRLNWSILLFGPAAVAAILVLGHSDWSFVLVYALLAFLYIASAVSYLVQKKRFARVADLVAEM